MSEQISWTRQIYFASYIFVAMAPSLHFASRSYGYFEVLVQAYASLLSHAAHISKRSIGLMEVSLERTNEWL